MDPLDVLGKFLVCNVRDKGVDRWSKLLDGQLKGVDAEAVREKLRAYPSADVVDFAHWLIPQVVENTIQKLLSALEQDESVFVSVVSDGVVTPDIKEMSDGLAGELFGEAGWIARFRQI